MAMVHVRRRAQLGGHCDGAVSAIILYNNKTITLTMSTYAAISRGNDGLACAFAAILTVLTALSLILYLAVTKSEDIKL